MNFTIPNEDLLRMIGKLKGIPHKTPTMPILTHLHLIIKGDNLIVAATDLELFLRIKGKAQVFDEGNIALPADPLFRIIKKMPDENVSLALQQNTSVRISCGSARYNLLGLSGEEFPDFPELSSDKRFPVSSRTLVTMLEKTMFAAFKKDNAMPHLAGVLLEATAENGKSTISTVATDGHRLAKVETRSTNGIPKFAVIIPIKGCAELLRIARETDTEIELAINENSLFVSKENESLTIRLVGGTFPNYRAVTASVSGKTISSKKRSLEDCLERTLIMANGSCRQVTLNLQNKDKLVISAKNHDLGEAQDSLTIRSELDETSLCFNPDYLLEGLRVMKSHEVEILLKDPQSPAFITGKEDEGFSYIVMPMRG